MERQKQQQKKFYAAKKTINTWDVSIDIVISKLIETKINSNYLIGYLGRAIRSFVLILPKMRVYVKTFKVKDEVKDKSNKLMSSRIDDEKLLEKHKTICTKIENFKNTGLNALSVYDDRYIKIKIRTYGDKVYTNFCGLNVPEDDIECESFTVIFINSLLVYKNKYSLQVYLDNCAYKIENNKWQIMLMTIFLKLMKINSYK